jgi:hypothetical protein
MNIYTNSTQVSPEEKLNGLRELAVYNGILRRCKWYQIAKKRQIKILIESVKRIYEL